MIREFTIHTKPKPKARPRVTKYGTFTPKETRDYEELVRNTYKLKYGDMPKLEGSLVLRVDFGMPMPASWSNKKRELYGETHHTQKPDLDNLVKSITDALNGVAFTDDSSIAVVCADKVWAKSGDEGFCRVALQEIVEWEGFDYD